MAVNPTGRGSAFTETGTSISVASSYFLYDPTKEQAALSEVSPLTLYSISDLNYIDTRADDVFFIESGQWSGLDVGNDSIIFGIVGSSASSGLVTKQGHF